MTPEIRPEFRGEEEVAIVEDVTGSTDYVPGRGADMVPSRIGVGRLEVHSILKGHTLALDALFVLEGLSSAGVQAVRDKVRELQGADGKGKSKVTQAAVLEALAA